MKLFSFTFQTINIYKRNTASVLFPLFVFLPKCWSMYVAWTHKKYFVYGLLLMKKDIANITITMYERYAGTGIGGT